MKVECSMKRMLLFILFLSISFSVYSQEYRYKKGDYIDVFVYNSPELCGEFRIHPDGNIRLPLIGKVYVFDKTEKELDDALRSAISVFIKNPYITVYPKFTVSVIGYVNSPGVFKITGSERIIEMIAQAGGFSPEASGKVTVYRNEEQINISKKHIVSSNSELGKIEPVDIIVAKKKRFTRSDYSILLSTISMIVISIYYFNR